MLNIKSELKDSFFLSQRIDKLNAAGVEHFWLFYIHYMPTIVDHKKRRAAVFGNNVFYGR